MTRDKSDLDQWLERSTQASGVSVKVKSPAVITALQVLMQGSRRAKALAENGRQRKS
jgi:hypothetical protein